MGRPGYRWKLEFTRKYVLSIRQIDGSGAKPGIIGLWAVEVIAGASKSFSLTEIL
jgi:hypothetical protein